MPERTRSARRADDIQIAANGDDEKSRPRLRHEQRGIRHEFAATVSQTDQRAVNGPEIPSPARDQRSGHVLERDRLRGAAVFREFPQYVREGPEGARPFPSQTSAGARER